MDPTVDYFHLGELTGSGDLAFNLCWRADTFVIFDKTTEHCPTEFIFGRLDHSPGFPTLPGQPGTVVTHKRSSSSLTSHSPLEFFCLRSILGTAYSGATSASLCSSPAGISLI